MNENDWKCRTELLLKKEGVDKLKQSKVLIVGLGGVGGYAAEQICRAGINNLTIIDCDVIQASNKNRQIIALESTLGKDKTVVFERRLKDINPDLNLEVHNLFVCADNIYDILKSGFDYVVDAIDTLTPKVDLLEACVKTDTRVISSMGSGARLDPSLILISDIKKSHDCRLAYLVRKNLHRRGIREGIKVVFSVEKVPGHAIIETDGANNKRTTVGTISYLPAIFGCYCASVVIRDLLN